MIEIVLKPDPLNLSVMWVIFAIVFVALNRLVFAPTLKLIDKRKEQTDTLKEQATALMEGVGRQMSRYEEAITAARLNAGREREAIIHEARDEERNMINKARGEIEGELKILKGKIDEEKKRVSLVLQEQAKELAREMVNKILERKAA